MINLNELKLHLSIIRYNSTYIDGIQLHDQILINMTQLIKFTFSIQTTVLNRNIEIDLPSNDNIQFSFAERRGYQQIGSYVQQRITKNEGICHIYSLPYDFEYFVLANNSFEGGMFHNVRYLTMSDIHPIEHKLFKLISKDLPFLKHLCIRNDQPQKHKQDSSILITFPHLTLLHLWSAHIDYAEQFLLKKTTNLPCLLNLYIEYEALVMITNNFTDDITRFNLNKLTSLEIKGEFVHPETFQKYFPLL
jgi:hypothetical protein